MVPDNARTILDERLQIEHLRQLWASPDDPTMIYEAAVQADAQIVFLDSGKDIANGPLKEESSAKALMDAIQVCIANNVDIVMLHHPRKLPQDNTKKEMDIDDVYGSAWLTAGSGSVLLVQGLPGQGIFKLTQLKAPSTFVPAFDVLVDYHTGTLTKQTIRDLGQWLKQSGMPTTVRQAVAFVTREAEEDVDPDSAPYKDTKRKLQKLHTDGLVTVDNSRPAKYSWVVVTTQSDENGVF